MLTFISSDNKEKGNNATAATKSSSMGQTPAGGRGRGISSSFPGERDPRGELVRHVVLHPAIQYKGLVQKDIEIRVQGRAPMFHFS